MKYSETTAAKCRYGEVAQIVFGDWEILWEDSEEDYQGHASLLGRKGRRYFFYEWDYGSCSGCDGWEADEASDEDIAKEMRDTALYFDSEKQLKAWLDRLDGDPRSNASMERGGGLAYALDSMSGNLRGRIDAIRKELGMPALFAEGAKP